ncbi:MAG: ATP-binding protein [Candidatus Babeliales bacterium]
MKRLIDYYLLEWKNKPNHKPLLLRGARQVGKTYAVRTLAKTFENYIELNLESNTLARKILSEDLNIERILLQLSESFGQLTPGTTLLFIDEIQHVPQAIIALRYFYEFVPNLHVIAAGSLLDFAIEEVGLPVGRVTIRYMYPLSFLEFLAALGHSHWVLAIISDKPVFEELHKQIINLLSMYLAIGGMPAAVNNWQEAKNSRAVKETHTEILTAYVGDFNTYAKKHQQKYLSLIFDRAMQQLARKFMFARIGEYKKRELEPALLLLEKAGIIYPIYENSGQGIPLGSDVNFDDFKVIFLDIGLAQAQLKFDISSWLINPQETIVNQGELVEAFIGQELLAYSDPIKKEQLYYWRKKVRGSDCEVDYLTQLGQKIIPIEVKSGRSTRLLSMHRFLETHPKSPYGIRFWANTETKEASLHSLPLYAVAKPFLNEQSYLKQALMFLITD